VQTPADGNDVFVFEKVNGTEFLEKYVSRESLIKGKA
jgi:hypothetical protein